MYFLYSYSYLQISFKFDNLCHPFLTPLHYWFYIAALYNYLFSSCFSGHMQINSHIPKKLDYNLILLERNIAHFPQSFEFACICICVCMCINSIPLGLYILAFQVKDRGGIGEHNIFSLYVSSSFCTLSTVLSWNLTLVMITASLFIAFKTWACGSCDDWCSYTQVTKMGIQSFVLHKSLLHLCTSPLI